MVLKLLDPLERMRLRLIPFKTYMVLKQSRRSVYAIKGLIPFKTYMVLKPDIAVNHDPAGLIPFKTYMVLKHTG